MQSSNYIVADPKVMLGKPVIKGTRITVEFVLESFGNGESMESFLKSYPHLNEKQILAAFKFASEVIKTDKVYPVAS